MKEFIAILIVIVMALILYNAATQGEAENTVKQQPIEAPATTAQEKIVTGVCTFGDCPVATTAATPTLPPTTEPETEHARDTYTLPEPVKEWDGFDGWSPDYSATYTAHEFCQLGEIYWGGWRWTWYSEKVLPGGGLDIPGRHTEGGYVRDGDGYICLASDALSYGTVIDTPFGGCGKIYDCGCDDDTVDVYVNW